MISGYRRQCQFSVSSSAAARAPRTATPPLRRQAGDELAPLHSITSSARPSMIGGTSMPSVLAGPEIYQEFEPRRSLDWQLPALPLSISCRCRQPHCEHLQGDRLRKTSARPVQTSRESMRTGQVRVRARVRYDRSPLEWQSLWIDSHRAASWRARWHRMLALGL